MKEKFERPRAAITDAPARLGAALPDAVPQLLRQPGRRRFLEHFLMAALHRAIALAQVNGVAMLVGQYLEFDMARIVEVFLHVNGIVVERCRRLGTRHGDGI